LETFNNYFFSYSKKKKYLIVEIMAGIDKIYGTFDQCVELRNWLKENEKPINCRMGWCSEEGDTFEDVLPSEFVYQGEEISGKIVISNFPEKVDMWLLENCPLDWVVNCIKEQYGKL